MWKTSGSGLPTANKKKLVWRNSVGFLTCREKRKERNWVAVVTKTATEAALYGGKKKPLIGLYESSTVTSPTLDPSPL